MARPLPQRKRDSQLIIARREQVARLRLKGLSQREIVRELAEMGVLNPETGKHYKVMSINRDCQELDREWRERQAADTDQLRGTQLAEIREARRVAWKNNDLNAVYRGMELEIKLLGTAAPDRSEISGPGGGPIQHEYSDAELVARLNTLLDAARTRGVNAAVSAGPE